MSFEEFSVDALAFDPAHVHVIERFNKTVSYFINGRAHDVVYVNDLAAIAAYDAFIAFKNLPRPINKGDIVRLRSLGNHRTVENVDYTVTNVPDLNFPWWALLGNTTGKTYILETSSILWLELVPPP